ncbi:uncharacterized protein AMSG_05226 [Thecamonas trahens ATCC 50062]|uniref:Biogenesis of lysosome-related organelles complex 1 subunit 5 n=1 Tax=Thecamonas trahens ATCC 50062 TaxID=461836 RepID=A0A0L0DAX0_THETB|nr:hypothetical protein AMSG_05226 [Thecamonas trahens ATCC 50062]KNC49236.1 hypothetical protein AMSG_05226 [Thecamonas trahens ATCC 50062]|eukprot:XP_013757953.1 hypothetical protein AMSG_05226 [Thecamonas trahens ATCC 50062]
MHKRSSNPNKMQNIVDDVASLYGLLVDQSAAVEASIKTTVREVETKRGERDLTALQDATGKVAAVHSQLAPTCMAMASSHFDAILSSLNHTIAMVNDQVTLEASREAARAEALAQLVPKEEAIRRAFAEDIASKKDAFDAEIEAEAERIRAKYHKPALAPQPSEPVTADGDSNADDTSAAAEDDEAA